MVDLAQRCREVMGELLSHISTADTARDLEVLRALSGEETLTYVGFSCGTMLGQTYANMVPERAANNASSPDAVFAQFAELCDEPAGAAARSPATRTDRSATRGPAVRDAPHGDDPSAQRRPAGRARLQRPATELVLRAARPDPVAGVGRAAERRRRR
ncbi:MAG: alpha/beta fold hydrolase [Ilumatobacteraceae bacterium]